ncbi:hypothetical protein RND81_02G206500 [Saponaria officinalis]|uniref:WIT1/2 N-terminal helical bundle domain-containing protein n=1 Tax=Saponaria officinalis TaxID=3572 RepID=A0AAW1MV27_SAPOF
MDASVISNDTDDANSKPSSNFVYEELIDGENGVEESSMLMEMLTGLNINLACSSEKLTNLDVYMAIVSLGESQLGELSMDVEIEKALIFDLSLGYLESEVISLKRFLNDLRTEIIDAHKKLHSLGQRREIFTAFEGKLRASECSLNRLLEQLSGLERQSAIMRGTPYGQTNPFLFEEATSEMSESDLQTTEQQRLVLRMLDKSLSGELDLENQLLDSKKRVEELNSKLLNANVVVANMESYVEVALERLLEAEHSSDVYLGISKEMMSRLQTLQFNVHCSGRREEELKSKLQISLDQLKEKETALINMEGKFVKLNQIFHEKEKLEEKVKKLEETLSVSEAKLRDVNGSYEASQEELSLMENTIESLREHVFLAETRAQTAVDKLTTLTEENIEVREELAFLKGGDDNVEKISLLQKQVRELEVVLQTAKTTSEASLEQQNMLYTAIWDMETLIEELRSKVSTGESRADSAEKQCLALAETNIKLNKEISYLKSDSKKLEESLKDAHEMRVARAKDLCGGAELITKVVVELAGERERIQKQLSAMARENMILLEELRKMRKIVLMANHDNKQSKVHDTDAIARDAVTDVSKAVSTTEEVVETPTSTTASNQVGR